MITEAKVATVNNEMRPMPLHADETLASEQRMKNIGA
jgi:hypothetical protein